MAFMFNLRLLSSSVKFLCCAILLALVPEAVPQTKAASKASWDSFYAEQMKLRQSGTAALERERTRSKANLCEKAGVEGGKAIVDCLVAETTITEKDYLTYVRAIGALLRLRTPDEADQKTPKRLPFDAAEEDWQKYRDQSCKSVSTQWIDVQSSISDADCRLKLTWNHMHELESLYSDLWH
jgi:hypothetical protein